MKNKVIKLVLFFVIGFTMLFTIVCSSNKKVKAEPSFHEFSEFSFVISPNIDLTGEAYWNVKITWKTIEELKFLEVKMFLEDGHEELVYVDGRENLSTKTYTKVDDGYYYTLQFDINSNANLQGIELKFRYSYSDEIPNESETTTKTYLLSTGNTKLPQKINFGPALLIGVIASGCAGLSTFIIVQNTKKDLIKIKDDDNMEEFDNEQLSE